MTCLSKPPKLKREPSGVFLEVLLPLHWWQPTKYRLLDNIECAGHQVPAGFVSDGATVSRWLVIAGLLTIALAHIITPWLYPAGLIGVIAPALFPRVGKYIKAAIVHDFYLQQGLDRKTCDQYFKQCLEVLGVSHWRAVSMFFAVRAYSIIRTF